MENRKYTFIVEGERNDEISDTNVDGDSGWLLLLRGRLRRVTRAWGSRGIRSGVTSASFCSGGSIMSVVWQIGLHDLRPQVTSPVWADGLTVVTAIHTQESMIRIKEHIWRTHA
jgi:hypothetical protein